MFKFQLVRGISLAIARMEGFYKAGSLAQKNNNPGNLRSWGDRPVVKGYAKFPSVEDGFAALRRQIELLIGRGLTMYEFFGGKRGVYPGYAPSGDGNKPKEYAEFVARQVGVDPNVPLRDVIEKEKVNG